MKGSVSMYLLLEKKIDGKWWLEGSYNVDSKSDMNALVTAAYTLGLHKVMGTDEGCIRAVRSVRPAETVEYPKDTNAAV